MEDWKSNVRVFATLATPGTLWLLVFFLIPLGFLAVLSFSSKDGVVDYTYFTGFSNYAEVFSSDIIKIFLRTVWWSFLATVACLVIGYPLAFGICFMPERWRPLALLLIILPFWINLLIRTYALKGVMGANGVINTALDFVGIPKLEMLGTTGAVIFGLVYVFLPFMILPLYSTIERLDKSYLEASLDLGATQFQTFRKVTLPLTMPGVVTGIILRYGREAEVEADKFAREVMTKASVDPIGLKTFFEKLRKLEGTADKPEGSESSALDRIGNVFSTHPGTEDRIKEIQPLPPGQTARKIMTDAQWQALRKACD